METVVHNVQELKGSERSAAEQLVGHALGENQQIVIQIIDRKSDRERSSDSTQEGKLPDWCNVYQDLTDDEIANIENSIVRDGGSRACD